jgi:hypothetical protein
MWRAEARRYEKRLSHRLTQRQRSGDLQVAILSVWRAEARRYEKPAGGGLKPAATSELSRFRVMTRDSLPWYATNLHSTARSLDGKV